MKLYTAKKENAASPAVVLDDMLLTKDLPTSAGSKMLDGYKSLFGTTVEEKLAACGYTVSGKASVGELAIDLLGESSYYGAVTDEKGNLSTAAAEILKTDDVAAVLAFDVNGAPRRSAALSSLVYLKPTYGTVSRFGTIPAACSGECVGIMAKNAASVESVLRAVNGHDDKDGTSLPTEACESALVEKKTARVAVLTAFLKNVDEETLARTDAMKKALSNMGVTVAEESGETLTHAYKAWNALMCAELCNNVSRYDGVKYGYRTPNYESIDELYTGSRTEAFGELLKTAILYGSEALSTDNYMKVYDKALRVRRVMVDALTSLLKDYDSLLLPVSSKTAYKPEDVALTACFDENLYTAPASISGLPAIVFGGVQFIGAPLSDASLVALAKTWEKEGK